MGDGRELKVNKTFWGMVGEKSSAGTEMQKAPRGKMAPTRRPVFIGYGW
jgi:hypothetical protein